MNQRSRDRCRGSNPACCSFPQRWRGPEEKRRHELWRSTRPNFGSQMVANMDAPVGCHHPAVPSNIIHTIVHCGNAPECVLSTTHLHHRQRPTHQITATRMSSTRQPTSRIGNSTPNVWPHRDLFTPLIQLHRSQFFTCEVFRCFFVFDTKVNSVLCRKFMVVSCSAFKQVPSSK